MKKTITAGLIGAGMLLALNAEAALLGTTTRIINFPFPEGAPVFLPLNDGGGTTVAFNTTAARQKVVVSFTAECANSDDTGSWVNIDILVDGVAIRPTNSLSSDAFCTSDGTSRHIWAAQAYNAVYVVPNAGAHVVRIRATISAGNGGATGWIGDSSTIIWR